MTDLLFSHYRLGDLDLPNRMVMAPMTRNRATSTGIVRDITVEYYRQRASAGLIITEATQVAPGGIGYPATPGIHSDDQVAAWRKVTDAVHHAGGRIFIQLWYCGRISHPSLLPDNQLPVAPSPIKPQGEAITYQGPQPYVTPHALSIDEIASIVEQYRQAASQAQLAGFDGIELHAGNGYLIDQFLRDGSNRREDNYGGNRTNRMRFLNEIINAVSHEWPSQRIGIRLSPENRYNSMSDSDPDSHFRYFIEQLAQYDLAYLHVLEGDMMERQRILDYRALRQLFGSSYIANQGYDRASAEQALQQDDCDLVSLGLPFLANPDLVDRYKSGAELNTPDPDTFYRGKAKGYIDYPFMPAQAPHRGGSLD